MLFEKKGHIWRNFRAYLGIFRNFGHPYHPPDIAEAQASPVQSNHHTLGHQWKSAEAHRRSDTEIA